MRKIGITVLSTLLFVGVLLLLPITVFGGVSKKNISRDIAIVFDNSGSMYTSGNKAWSEATYAIEVFASMLNDGDSLSVFPMNPVTVDGKEYSENNPLQINKPSEAKIIEKMVTPNSAQGDTPIGTIKLAHKKVKKSDKDEQWLIVLTDGAEFYDVGNKYVDCAKDKLEILSAPGTDDDGKISALKDSLEESEKNEKPTIVGARRALSTMLSDCAKDVNTLYLGIGSIAVKPEITGEYAHEPQQAESAQVPSVLGEMCNMIFGRNVLEMSNDTITFDIPLSKLIVFIQGEEIADVALKGSSKLSPKESLMVKYSESGTEGGKWTPNTSLQGVITTYVDGLQKDEEYKLSYSGNKSDIKVYYEPDVDLDVDMIDALGNSVKAAPDIYAGDYQITYRMVDSEGNDVSESKLLGNTIYDIVFTVNGNPLEMPANDKAGAIPVTLNAGDVLGFEKAQVTFLKNYTISKTPEDLGFKFDGGDIGDRPNTLIFEIIGGSDVYQLSRLEDDGVYQIKAYYNSEPIGLDKIDGLKVTVDNGGEGIPVAVLAKDGNTINLQYYNDAEGTAVGDHELKVAGSYSDAYNNVTIGQSVKPFSLVDDSRVLAATIETKEDYYLLKNLGNDTPVLISVTADGQPISDEEMRIIAETPGSIRLTTEDNINVDVAWTPLYGTSTFSAEVLKDGTEAGTHKVNGTVSLSTRNQKYTSAEASGYVRINSIPRWLTWLIILLALLLLAALIFLILNTKILPSDMYSKIAETEAMSGRDTMAAAPIKYARGATIFGRIFSDASLIVMSGVDGDGQSISPIRLRIKKTSKIKDVLFSRRTCKVIATMVEPSPTIKEISLAGNAFEYNKEMQRFTDVSEKLATEHPVLLSEGSMIDIQEAVTGYRRTKKLTYSVRIHMKW